MPASIKIYKYGLHYGEESLVQGNSQSGMINFSGCHLACRFCYTPETSVYRLGDEYTAGRFYGVLTELESRGAANINLISPTHIWDQIEESLTCFKSKSKLPLILKISGFESSRMIRRMAAIADVFVPDFKLWSTEAALKVNLPSRYGQVALSSIQEMGQTHGSVFDTESPGKLVLKKGILVRHLIMPGCLEESFSVIRELSQIGFEGFLNFMPYFIEPGSFRVRSASPSEKSALLESANAVHLKTLWNGKLMEVVYA